MASTYITLPIFFQLFSIVSLNMIKKNLYALMFPKTENKDVWN